MARIWSLPSLLILAACSSTGPSEPEHPVRVNPNWVTGDAASHLGANGRFELTYLVTPGPGDLSEAAGTSIATAFVHAIQTSVGGLRAFVEEGHGGPLDFAGLVPCSRTMWQQSPWTVPASGGPHYLRNSMGNYFWFTYCTPSGVLGLFEEFAAQSAVTVSNGGQLTFPTGSGNDFLSWGIPLDRSWELSPEVAVKALVEALPRKVARVGKFTGCPWSIPPCFGGAAYVWHLFVDRPIRVRRVSDQVEVDAGEFYVEASHNNGVVLNIMVPEAVQPPDQWLLGSTSVRPDSIWVVRRGPVRFSRIEVVGN